MKYIFIIISILFILTILSLCRVASNADRKIEAILKEKNDNLKDNDIH
ncbi:hypothetical protein CPAST_c18490 [Clostridium pasteurianum DSM 525 = ATCC 6013]|uniref:Uncharacterized protein n=1 Tax=Clostridium pasteurianum DSM 525 = ATCC 6013 TaxID=1262449 RepID=A0A0H3J379_CLOPA|nr:hypothetical protein [Clostridium pasteurianum]AJA47919.1 hypothetical protein CPAST_c18490 [Clostridium pasteurianum DSM 525 = ATCC 6013]AJA51907.1 hypothetical protein CLPA_c18490 [Clostridium pasteurianum DSM 525 = ATCC 6013]KRU12085.1 hypothetical protein CP6013_01332 [Clostridium pasteurianum DSM 525 = ATCC 6013]UZW16093.1 hypothetical protein OSC52_09835 [Clostridium pasteurianum]